MSDYADARAEYTAKGLHETDLTGSPYPMFERWYAEAHEAGLVEPNAMVVSTAGVDGTVSSRMVLLKEVFGDVGMGLPGGPEAGDRPSTGFVFYTNLESAKGLDIAANPSVALLFPWHQLERQIRIEGTASLIDRERVDAYFAKRPRGSQIGAWASPQSQPVADRSELERRYREAEERFGEDDVPAPPHWGGVLVTPQRVEFWQGRPGRMHDRLRYRLPEPGDVAPAGWAMDRLAP